MIYLILKEWKLGVSYSWPILTLPAVTVWTFPLTTRPLWAVSSRDFQMKMKRASDALLREESERQGDELLRAQLEREY